MNEILFMAAGEFKLLNFNPYHADILYTTLLPQFLAP